jgi:UDP-N-acetylglucosamine acyltransferase
MPPQIHPNAMVEEGAQLGAGCVIHAYASISRHCQVAEGVIVHPFAVIGGDPQDLSFKADTPSGVRIGAGTASTSPSAAPPGLPAGRKSAPTAS